jgi:hypothetical protein
MTPRSYNILGWVLFTLGLFIFIFWANQDSKSPNGSKQTFVWTVGGAILLYFIAGFSTFTSKRLFPQAEDTSIADSQTKPLTYYNSSFMGGLMS